MKNSASVADAGILVAGRRANQLAYTTNRPSPIYDELASIMRKASGLADILANALVPLADQIRIAFVFGSVARAQETADSDIDIMILGAATFGDIVKLLYPAQATLGLEIDPKVMSLEEWQASVDRNDGFAQELINKSKVFVLGNDHDFAELTRNKP